MNPRWIAFLRIVTGLFFIGQGVSKLSWFASSEFLRTSLDRYAVNPASFTQWYQNHVAYPGIEVWARMMPTGEILIGVALVLGLLTRPALIFAIALVLNYYLANGSIFSADLIANPHGLLLLAVLLILFTSKAGAVFALDTVAKRGAAKAKS